MVGKSHLTDMSNDEQLLLYSLPYRVGVWMSLSDDEDGEADDIKEAKALRKAIKDLATGEGTVTFVKEVFSETLSHEDHWEKWAGRAFDILGDCEKAVTVLEKQVSQDDRRAYKKALLKVAAKVAGAHGEFGEDFIEEGFLDRLKKFIKKAKGDNSADFLNISAAEDASLYRLATALHIEDKNA